MITDSVLYLSLSSSVYCEELVPERATEAKGATNKYKNAIPHSSQKYAVEWEDDVSSAVENAKRMLGLDSLEADSPPMSPRSTGDTRALLLKMKKEFNEKILHSTEKLNAAKTPATDKATLAKQVDFKEWSKEAGLSEFTNDEKAEGY